MSEEWRPVVGFEGSYEVSNCGRVRSVTRFEVYQRRDQYSGRIISVKRRHAGTVLKPATTADGRRCVVLGRGNTKLIHALVLAAFVGPRPEGADTCHNDGDPSNNHISNLRWDSRSANIADSMRHGTIPLGQKKWNAKLRDQDIPNIRNLFGKVSYSEIARRYGVSDATIRQIKNGRTWTHIREDHDHAR